MNNKIVKFSALAAILIVVGTFACFFAVGKYSSKLDNPSQAVLLLKQGSRGSDVSVMQQKLKNWGYYTGGVDGVYGAKTKQAVINFQKKNKLVADGIAGTKTLAAMGIAQKPAAQTTSSKIKEVQQKLKNWGYYTGSVDGISGPKTKQAIINFQKKNGLVADGIAGAKTLAAMGLSTQQQQSTGSNYNSSDTYLLAKCVYAEARGEPYIGQVAVAAVILNRVKHSQFPNTISGVIYQPYAFTAVADGQINLEPDQTAKNAARDAMNGWDPTYGAIYYYNPAVATSKWIFSRKVVLTIGMHSFAI